jgi:hypothetical protein
MDIDREYVDGRVLKASIELMKLKSCINLQFVW